MMEKERGKGVYMKTLFLSDLDGTLLGADAVLSDYTRETINRLVREGMYFTYATARSYRTASKVLRGLHCSVPAVTHNGGFLTDPEDGTVLQVSAFGEEEAAFARGVFEECRISPYVYSLFGELSLPGREIRESMSWIAGTETPGMIHFNEDHAGDPRMRPVRTKEELYEGVPFYYNLIDDRERLREAALRLDGHPGFYYTFQRDLYRTEDFWLEIMPAHATKAEGLKRLKEKYGFDRVICFGDAMNDMTMFDAADEAYAMENAAQPLKEKASGIIGSNREDGVARWLLQYWEERMK